MGDDLSGERPPVAPDIQLHRKKPHTKQEDGGSAQGCGRAGAVWIGEIEQGRLDFSRAGKEKNQTGTVACLCIMRFGGRVKRSK
jgi:hypothetical protein